MILDKLLKTTDHASRIIAHPFYQIFPHRLVLKYFNEINTNYESIYNSNLNIKKNLEIYGLLNPIIIDGKNKILDGNQRFFQLKKYKISGSLFYKSNNDDETTFLVKVNEKIYSMHQKNKLINDWNFLFENDLIKFTEKNMKILQEGVNENTIFRT